MMRDPITGEPEAGQDSHLDVHVIITQCQCQCQCQEHNVYYLASNAL